MRKTALRRTHPIARGRPIARRSELARRSPVAKSNAKRKRQEFARAYGGTERVEWTKALPCIACSARQQIEVAHTVTGGTGRKANASRTVPLCSWCHAELHRIGVRTFEATYDVNLEREAAKVEAAWQAYTNRNSA